MKPTKPSINATDCNNSETKFGDFIQGILCIIKYILIILADAVRYTKASKSHNPISLVKKMKFDKSRLYILWGY